MAREVAEAMLCPWERHNRMSPPYGTLVLSPEQPPFLLPSTLSFRSPFLSRLAAFLLPLRSQVAFLPQGHCERKVVERDKAFLALPVLSVLALSPWQPCDLCGAPSPGMLWAIRVLRAVLGLNQHFGQKIYG